ncbi:hypothetical protein [Planctomycetes bacterium TBK1r]|uniref:Uncharacterized protein n=1 Tax=Stieleria magnilauensis TaxID=2527963 RepID=A0ABX5XXZ0_9BACT|nr:hypothetical protein TBK1r_59290 [Planctomycetes bacterium TBK1r]QDV86980.1 hypothetical protein TBK1r_60070 [Planctomycetes bacterium TBK1r]
MTTTQKADAILAALKSTEDRWGDRKFPKARIWTGGDTVRIYTGHASEYITVTDDGCERCKANMSWGGDIDDAVESVEG